MCKYGMCKYLRYVINLSYMGILRSSFQLICRIEAGLHFFHMYIQKMKKEGIKIGIFMIIIFYLIDLISGDKDCDACFSGTGMYKRPKFDMESNLQIKIRAMFIEF